MAWELLAILALVASSLVWFAHDEKRRRMERLDEQARYYATARPFRHRLAMPIRAMPRVPARPRGLTDVQRKFLEEYAKRRS